MTDVHNYIYQLYIYRTWEIAGDARILQKSGNWLHGKWSHGKSKCMPWDNIFVCITYENPGDKRFLKLGISWRGIKKSNFPRDVHVSPNIPNLLVWKMLYEKYKNSRWFSEFQVRSTNTWHMKIQGVRGFWAWNSAGREKNPRIRFPQITWNFKGYYYLEF